MKKNLRIVSAAAAALLAVAPVAASAVSVNAATVNSTNTTVSGLGKVELNNGDVVNVKPNLNLTTTVNNPLTGQAVVDAALNASFTATVNGTTATSTFKPQVSSVELWKTEGDTTSKVPNDKLNSVVSGYAGANGNNGHATFQVKLTNVGLNFGSQNGNKEITLKFPDGDGFKLASNNSFTNSRKIKLDQNGTVTLNEVVMKVVPKDYANPAIVNWHDAITGSVVKSGDVTLYAGSDAGKMNVNEVLAAIKTKYYAENTARPQSSSFSYTTVDELTKQLADQGMKVTDGWFVPNKSFTVNFKATASNNDASSTLAVTVNVPNGKVVTPATVPSTGTVKIMHAAYTYELKDGKLTRVTSADTLHAYNVIPVYGTTTVNGKKYYRVSGEHEWYINAGNVDGTSRTLNHNSYVYNNKGKRVKSEGTWKKGSKHTTYGAAMNIKGQRMYRVNENRYVKVVNFDKN
ncbi:SLAP domain-containing protein [Lactobacillus amylovorus]|uniref:SLAP domain-containing protein n=1 Tax=Lactobacillus amylovorus TaxID=1604 RepID=UPI0022DF4496|nr:SLAP domain-containing protein [Lactobacillus amylovorus]